jgi:hypothetical protein
LLRCCLVRVSEQAHLLLLAMHHAIIDLVSGQLLLRELVALYGAFQAGKPSPLPEPVLQYRDFTRWQREWLGGEVLDQLRGWWEKRLAGAPHELVLRCARPRPPVESLTAATHAFELPDALHEQVDAFCRNEGLTPFLLTMGTFQILLALESGQEDVLVGFAHANRPRPELESLLGMLAGYLVVRVDLSGNPSVREALHRVRASYLAAFAHQGLPHTDLVRLLQAPRAPQHRPPGHAGFAYASASPASLGALGLSMSEVPLELGLTTHDLGLTLVDEPGGKLRGVFEYKTELFDAATMSALSLRYQELLRQVVSAPEQSLHGGGR